MKLLVGLGNPGQKYKNTRHNVGFLVVDKLAEDLGHKVFAIRKDLKSYIIIHKSCILAKPTTFMNSSGVAVGLIAKGYKLKAFDIYVIHDDLDLRLGEFKIQSGRGPKDQGGVNSIEKYLKTKDFWRVRIGVDNRDPKSRISGEEYVLQNFENEEIKIRDRVIKEVTNELKRRLF